MWENVFSATIKITNTAKECLTITKVFGEYLNHGKVLQWICIVGYPVTFILVFCRQRVGEM